MPIRLATSADLPRLVAMGQRFHAETPYRTLYADNPAQLAQTATRLIEGPASAVFVLEQNGAVVGMLGLLLYAHHLSAERIAGEVMWWVEPEARGGGPALLRRAERWAAEAGAAYVHMIAPNARVGKLYERRGYQPIETAYYLPISPRLTALEVIDDVLPDVEAYRQAALQQPFGPVETSPGVVFSGIAPAVDGQLVQWVQHRYPGLTPTLTFLRRSPAGQQEPHFIHTDCDMGAWTVIYYLTLDPVREDGTTFWRWRETGAIQSTATTDEAVIAEVQAWPDRAQWEPWHTVAARPNRALIFPAGYFHSRAIEANVGEGDDARLIQLVFGTGIFPPEGV